MRHFYFSNYHLRSVSCQIHVRTKKLIVLERTSVVNYCCVRESRVRNVAGADEQLAVRALGNLGIKR